MNAEAWTAWMRLWAPELVVGAPTTLVALARMHPMPTVPWPGLNDSAAVQLWWHTLNWPDPTALMVCAAVLVLVWTLILWADLRLGRYWRMSRKERWRWERTDGTRRSSLKKIRVGQGVVTARCSIRKDTWNDLTKALDPDGGEALRGLRLNRKWGSPVRATISAAGMSSPAQKRTVHLNYVPLGDPQRLALYEKPAQGGRLFVGYTHRDRDHPDGELFVDLDETPHVAVRGATGSGKGVLINLMKGQMLRAGWLVLLLDGGNSPEHAAADPAATYWRPMRADQDTAGQLQAAIGALEVLTRLFTLRRQLGESFFAAGKARSSRWVDLPEDVKVWQPRVGLMVDENSTLLTKSNDKDLDGLRATLRGLLSELLRTGRKFGIHVVPMADQTSTYTTALARGDTIQAEHVIVLGNMDRGHAQAATDLPNLPRLPDGVKKLAGWYVQRGDPDPVELRLPPMFEDSVRRAALHVAGVSA